MHDAAAVAHYRAVLGAARDAGITPWVCLHHFTLPRWFARQGAFTMPVNRTEYWRRHVDFVAETFGDLVGGWQPVNEANIYPRLAYRGSGFAPGLDDRELWFAADRGDSTGHGRGRRASEADRRPGELGVQPCPARSSSTRSPRRSGSPRRSAPRNWDDWLTLYRDGALALPGRTPVERPDLAGVLRPHRLLLLRQHRACEAGRVVPYPSDAPTSPLGYTIAAEGLDLVLRRLHDELPGTPTAGG